MWLEPANVSFPTMFLEEKYKNETGTDSLLIKVFGLMLNYLLLKSREEREDNEKEKWGE